MLQVLDQDRLLLSNDPWYFSANSDFYNELSCCIGSSTTSNDSKIACGINSTSKISCSSTKESSRVTLKNWLVNLTTSESSLLCCYVITFNKCFCKGECISVSVKVYVVGVYDTADPEDSEPRPPLALGLILFPLTLYADAILLVVTEGESTVS